MRQRSVTAPSSPATTGAIFALLVAVELVRRGSAADRTGAALTLAIGCVLAVRMALLVRRLRAAAAESGAILASMSEGFAVTRDGVIVSVNQALCRSTGFSEDQLVGCAPPYPFWPQEALEHAEAVRRRIVASDGGDFELELVRADGTRFAASITATRTTRGTFLNTVRDVSAQRAHEESMVRRADDLAAIAEVTRVVGHSDPRSARQTICQVAKAVSDATTATIWEADADGVLHNTCMLGAPAPDFVLGRDDQAHGACVAMRVGQALFVADAVASPRVDARMVALLGAASAHFQPIEGPDGPRGVLAVSWSTPMTELSHDAALLLEVLAAEAATALERDALLRRLEGLSRTDELTGLPNRRAWDELLARERAVAARTGRPLSVAMLDLDCFKAYNDLHGHLAGDRLLRAAAAAWQSSLRETDLLARWGGEEFVLLLPGCDLASAGLLIERLRGQLPDAVTFSAGVASWDPLAAASADDLVAAADAALYAAKEGGRDRVVLAGVSDG
jgi:diguanylate cyclase (GGDEF)-like protein/PAS domain S-box-containing protein